jgi:UDP-3-O-[3-hydroxymyristoyl] glucosamine N-acyltransferase
VSVRIQPTAQVDEKAELGEDTTVWDLAQIREDARLGRSCIVGRGAYVGPGVWIGDNVKLQNYALVYEPAVLADGVFVGPAAVLTNDYYPRSVCVAPVRVGRWALVAAGAVVTRDVPDFALVAGVPARRIGWVGRAGVRLVERDGEPGGGWECPDTGALYDEKDGVLVERA